MAAPLPEGEQTRVSSARDALWRAVGERARHRELGSARGDDADDQETRQVVDYVMNESRADSMTDEEAREFFMSALDGPEEDELIPVTAERVGPSDDQAGPSATAERGPSRDGEKTLEELLREVQSLERR